MTEVSDKAASWLCLYEDEKGALCMDAEDALTLDDYKKSLKTRVPDSQIVGIFVRVE